MEYKYCFVEKVEFHIVEHCNLFCTRCCHFTPFFTLRYGKREYQASAYIPWLDEMLRRNIDFGKIVILGGEPFLHSGLFELLKELRGRYKKQIDVFTNGLWLSGPEKYLESLKYVDNLIFSKYPGVLEKIPDFDERVNKISSLVKGCQTSIARFSGFVDVDFIDKCVKPTRPCKSSNCLILESNGILWRCPTVSRAIDNVMAGKGILDARSKDAWYDLKKDDGKDFGDWVRRYPFEACGYCTVWEDRWIPWRSDVGYYRRIIGDKIENPKVSVIIPSFNYGNYLEESIKSVLNQTYEDFELILVNYGSTDRTADIMEKYGKIAKVLNIPNNDLSNARNMGIKEANGEYILCLDADDILLPNFLEEVMNRASESTIVATDGKYFGDKTERWISEAGGFIFSNKIMCCSLFPKSMWEVIGGFDEDMGRFEDWDFWIRAVYKGYKVSLVPKILVNIRSHNDSRNKVSEGWYDKTISYIMRKKEVAGMISKIDAIKVLMPMHHNYVLPDGTNTRVHSPVNYPQCMVDAIHGMFPISWKNLKVLDVGCNTGWMSRYVSERGAVCHGIDIEEQYLKQADAISSWIPTTAKIWKQDFLSMNGEQYDVVLFLGVIYHMRNYEEAFPKIRSLLVPNGWGIAETAYERSTRTYSGQLGDVYHGDPSNYWVPSLSDMRAIIEKAGLVVESVNEWIPLNPNGRLAVKFRRA